MKISKQLVTQKIMERKITEAPEDAALITQLNKVLADTAVFYFKAHTFHWNVEGPNFPEYHEFFAGVYGTAYARLDPLAEYVRQLGAYAPNSFGQLINTANLQELNSKPADAMSMFRVLKSDNDNIMVGLKACRKTADADGYTDIANFLDDMISESRKLNWMLESLLK